MLSLFHRLRIFKKCANLNKVSAEQSMSSLLVQESLISLHVSVYFSALQLGSTGGCRTNSSIGFSCRFFPIFIHYPSSSLVASTFPTDFQ